MTSDFNIAVHALVYLSNHCETLVSSDELARNICTHPVRVRRVMIKLREAGMVSTKAGVSGGYLISEDAGSITLSKVAKSLTQDYIHVTWHNGEVNKDCIEDSGMKDVMDDIFIQLNNACDDILKNITIEDIMKRVAQ